VAGNHDQAAIFAIGEGGIIDLFRTHAVVVESDFFITQLQGTFRLVRDVEGLADAEDGIGPVFESDDFSIMSLADSVLVNEGAGGFVADGIDDFGFRPRAMSAGIIGRPAAGVHVIAVIHALEAGDAPVAPLGIFNPVVDIAGNYAVGAPDALFFKGIIDRHRQDAVLKSRAPDQSRRLIERARIEVRGCGTAGSFSGRAESREKCNRYNRKR